MTAPQSHEPDNDTDLPHDLEQARKLRAENRNLRDRAKTAEEALETANTRLNAAHRREVERIAAATLADSKDVWTAGHDVGAFLTDDGEIDPAKITATTTQLVTDRPHWAAQPPPARRPPTDRPVETLRSAFGDVKPPPQPTWSEALRGQ